MFCDLKCTLAVGNLCKAQTRALHGGLAKTAALCNLLIPSAKVAPKLKGTPYCTGFLRRGKDAFGVWVSCYGEPRCPEDHTHPPMGVLQFRGERHAIAMSEEHPGRSWWSAERTAQAHGRFSRRW